MKYFFVTTAYSTHLEDELKNKCKSTGGLQYASNTFQHSVIQGFIANNADFEVISIPALPCYPNNYSSPYVDSSDFYSGNQLVGISEGYCTLIGVKDGSIRRRLTHRLLERIASCGINAADRFVVISYQPSVSLNSALNFIKSKYPNMIIATIVADAYEYEKQLISVRKNAGYLKYLQLKATYSKLKSLYKTIDKYILLTKPMLDVIPEAKDRYIIMEGLANESYNFTPNEIEFSDYKTIVYTGRLNVLSNIQHLLSAFMLTTDENYRLVITGSGELSELVKEKAKQDNRIIYKGVVSYEEMRNIQASATLLVNPRFKSGDRTRYFFPSKLMEYMLSGAPVLTYKLEGIPDEYYDVTYSIEDESAEAFSAKIIEILSLPTIELQTMARKAKDFIINNKTAKIQACKIISFLKKK